MIIIRVMFVFLVFPKNHYMEPFHSRVTNIRNAVCSRPYVHILNSYHNFESDTNYKHEQTRGVIETFLKLSHYYYDQCDFV